MVFNEEIETFKTTYGFSFVDTCFLKDMIENDGKLNKEVDYWGMNETETRSLVMNKISQTLIQKSYPTFRDDVDIDNFFAEMEERYNKLKTSRVFASFGGDWIEKKEANSALNWIVRSNNNWVYDKEKNVFFMFGMGFHVIAVNYLARNFYGLKWMKNENIHVWQKIISENMIIHGAMVSDAEHYVEYLPRTLGEGELYEQ